MQNPSLCPGFLHLWQWYLLNGHFQAKCQPPQFQQADEAFLCVEPDDIEFCSFWTALTVDLLVGTDWCTICESCLRFTNYWHSTATCCRIMFRFCSIFDRVLVQTLVSPVDLNPHTNIRHLNCAFKVDKILNQS